MSGTPKNAFAASGADGAAFDGDLGDYLDAMDDPGYVFAPHHVGHLRGLFAALIACGAQVEERARHTNPIVHRETGSGVTQAPKESVQVPEVGEIDRIIAGLHTFALLAECDAVRQPALARHGKIVKRAAELLAIPSPQVPAEDPRITTYEDMHEIARDLGYPSILEALEALERSQVPAGAWEAVETAVRVAVWNAAKGRGMGDQPAYDLIDAALNDPALDALRTPAADQQGSDRDA